MIWLTAYRQRDRQTDIVTSKACYSQATSPSNVKDRSDREGVKDFEVVKVVEGVKVVKRVEDLFHIS